MFDIGFSELILVFVIGLVVLGPQRLPVAVRTVVGWIRAMRSLAANVQNELAQELKLQELQDSLKKVEEASKNSLTPELKASMEELKQSAASMKRSYLGENEKADDEAHTIHNPLVKNPADAHDGATPATADHQASSPVQAPLASEHPQTGLSSAAVQPSDQLSASQPLTEDPVPVVHVSQAASPPVVKTTSTVSDPESVTTVSATTSILSSRAPVSTTQPGEQR
ncbi:Sec-independent protein translocase protein TatB [Erwinia mallotivora]|uniref:Sec-independent protein translocase protein TatB n=1 Tax=Erwinia mallotivora TaxID=69222 RepID=UPI0035EC8E52